MPESVVPGLKAAMKRAGYTQKKLADEMGIALSTVARWSGGGAEPSVSTIRRIAEILDSSMAELLGIETAREQKGCSILQVKNSPGKKIITIEISEK